jgi:signal transduction histidine kinase
MGFSEILDREFFGKLSNKQKEYTVGIQEAGERLLNLIDDILDLSTIEAGYMELIRAKIRLQDVFESLRDLVRDWARKENINFVLEAPEKDILLMADERRLKQILLNLIRNAITYTPAGGTITLGVRAIGGNAMITVRDTGQGIPKEDQERIFAPFEKSKEGGGRQGQGAGLGLSLVKNIVELHDGRITLESVEGEGTLVTITLPLA